MFETRGAEISCGVRQIWNLTNFHNAPNHIESFLQTIYKLMPVEEERAIIFSDRVTQEGSAIAAFLKARPELGSLTESPEFKNGSYGKDGSILKVWIFITTRTKLKAYNLPPPPSPLSPSPRPFGRI
jgi:hypothetical protein